jgi:hypothetical protein
VSAQKIEVSDLLPRMDAYIRTFVTNFSNVVAEETRQQQIPSPRRKRSLKSDLMLVKFPGAQAWYMFRDTFEVDGKPVRTEPERLTKLFVDAPASALQRAREISEASAKYNLANIGTLSDPLLVLALMQEEFHGRFRFTMGNIEKSLGPDVRTLQFQEFRPPSILKLDGSTDVFVKGLVFLEQSSGRIRKTQFNIGRVGAGIQIETTFRADDDLGIDVPAQMKEWYPDPTGGDITSEATYARFRRFSVKTEEALPK